MERQIMIKHQNDDIRLKVKNIIGYLSLFVKSKDKVVCRFSLDSKYSNVFNEIKSLEEYGSVEVVKKETIIRHKEYSECDVLVYLKDIEQFLDIAEKYELNVMILCNKIKVFINDNDGDFIIIDSNHEMYNALKIKKRLT